MKGRAQHASPRVGLGALNLTASVNPEGAVRLLLGPEASLTPEKLDLVLRAKQAGILLQLLAGMTVSRPPQFVQGFGEVEGAPSTYRVRCVSPRLVKILYPGVSWRIFTAPDGEHGAYAASVLVHYGQPYGSRFVDGTTFAHRLEALKSLVGEEAKQLEENREVGRAMGLGGRWGWLLRKRIQDSTGLLPKPKTGQPGALPQAHMVFRSVHGEFLRRTLRMPEAFRIWQGRLSPLASLGVHQEVQAADLRERLKLRSRLEWLRATAKAVTKFRPDSNLKECSDLARGLQEVAGIPMKGHSAVWPTGGVIVPAWREKEVFLAPGVPDDWFLISRRRAMVREILDHQGHAKPCLLLREVRPGFWHAVSPRSRTDAGLCHQIVRVPQDPLDAVTVVSRPTED